MRQSSRIRLAVYLTGLVVPVALGQGAGPVPEATVLEQAKLLPDADPLGGELGALFGRSVATEGALALIGVPSKDLFTGDTGVAHVFVRQAPLGATRPSSSRRTTPRATASASTWPFRTPRLSWAPTSTTPPPGPTPAPCTSS